MGICSFKPDDGRLDKVARAVDAVAAADDLAALLARPFQGVLIVVDGALVDQRAHEDAVFERIADGDAAVGLDELAHHVVGDGLVEEEPAQAGAALTGGAHRAEEDGAQRQVEVGVGLDDDGVVAAELEDAAAEASWRRLRRRAGPCCVEPVKETSGTRGSLIIRSPTTEPGPMDEVEDALQAVPLHHGVADVLHGDGGQRCRRRRLPDRGVAADGGQGRVPGPDRDREVEGRDDADHAQRVPLLVHPVARPLGVHGLAVELARQPDGEVADVDHLLDLAEALGQDLAHLQGDEPAQGVLELAQLVAEVADDLATHGRGDHAPLGEVVGRGLHDLFIGGFIGLDHRCDGLTGGGVDADEFAAVCGGDPFTCAGAGVGCLESEIIGIF